MKTILAIVIAFVGGVLLGPPAYRGLSAILVPPGATYATTGMMEPFYVSIGSSALLGCSILLLIGAGAVAPSRRGVAYVALVVAGMLVCALLAGFHYFAEGRQAVAIASEFSTHLIISISKSGAMQTFAAALAGGLLVFVLQIAASKRRQPNQALQTTPVTRSEI